MYNISRYLRPTSQRRCWRRGGVRAASRTSAETQQGYINYYDYDYDYEYDYDYDYNYYYYYYYYC